MIEHRGRQIWRGNLVLPDRVLENSLLVVSPDGVIEEIAADGAYAATHDYSGHVIAPGLIDLHTHGIAGADTMDASQDALALMARRYAAHGVCGFLPTTMTHEIDMIARAVEAVCCYMTQQDPTGAGVLGLHVEGPWISRRYKGAQNEAYIRLPSREDADRLLGEDATVRIVTLAPEVPGADETMLLLRERGVCISIGHTAATYEQAVRAIALGATQATHAFNAMSPLHQRAPGVVGAVLLHDELDAELIADGIHVHPELMRLLIRVKGREHVMLITDSMSATELPAGTYALGGQEVYVREGRAQLASGSLAGSTLTLDAAVRNVMRLCGVALHDAIYMASTVPARAIGLGERKGRLEPGYDADLAIFDAALQPVRIVLSGR